MTPTCLTLNELQKGKLTAFRTFLVDKVGEAEYTEAILEGATPTSPISFIVRSTGIGDSIEARGFGYKCLLSMDDDGALLDLPFIKEEGDW